MSGMPEVRDNVMPSRRFNFATGCSFAFLIFVALVWLLTAATKPVEKIFSLNDSCHLCLRTNGLDARVVLFSDKVSGPYTGSVVAFTGNETSPRVSGFGDAAGIYYRRITLPTGKSFWTVSLSLIYPLGLAAVLPLMWFIRRWRRQKPAGFLVTRVALEGQNDTCGIDG